VKTIHFNSNLIASNYHANNTFIVSCAVNFISSRSTFLSYFFLLFSPLSLIFSSPLLSSSSLNPFSILTSFYLLSSPSLLLYLLSSSLPSTPSPPHFLLPPLLLTPFYLLSSSLPSTSSPPHSLLPPLLSLSSIPP
jgi:hypothetical protein